MGELISKKTEYLISKRIAWICVCAQKLLFRLPLSSILVTNRLFWLRSQRSKINQSNKRANWELGNFCQQIFWKANPTYERKNIKCLKITCSLKWLQLMFTLRPLLNNLDLSKPPKLNQDYIQPLRMTRITLLEKPLLEIKLSENTLWENTLSENTLSENIPSENTFRQYNSVENNQRRW